MFDVMECAAADDDDDDDEDYYYYLDDGYDRSMCLLTDLYYTYDLQYDVVVVAYSVKHLLVRLPIWPVDHHQPHHGDDVVVDDSHHYLYYNNSPVDAVVVAVRRNMNL
jgi:hypothetical protein